MDKKGKASKKIKPPWPTKAAMEQVYSMNLWGGKTSHFYSGTGSHDPEIVNPYVKVVTAFLTAFETPLVVCDLGCGDFNVGKALVKHTKQFVAVDIVADLIARNKEQFQAEHLEFQCLDIAKDDLPSGDCVLLRQVLQHLSNAEIQQIASNLAAFKYVILTEHVPQGEFTPNKDIISGQGTRLKKQSGVNLLAPPFDFKIKEEKQLVSVVLDNDRGVIVTTLYTVF
ncbi:class I SAM-dependent methyltransferase [Lacinutrix sp. Hel_I_90]|uniref:class I SAM-dependent methyltransferase n=1 Tax=Lacinutrix sp. Hel_I_90 TaxID=1249999 RepID=UPI0005C8BC41|nr:class I SAM-dependent methyltransferase [Lacinutrix sp. Hel_I_90]